MEIIISDNPRENGEKAAEKAARIIRAAISMKGKANIVVATGASQFEFLKRLTSYTDIDWKKTAMFHLDEYIGIPVTHKASFRKYLKERFIDIVQPGEVFLIDGETDPQQECSRLNRIIDKYPIDVAFVGIGENGHLAFNDPPADFETEVPYIVVNLDELCRKQQYGEGWFPSVEEVPTQAISMSIRQIMKSAAIVCTVPGAQKTRAVADCFNNPVSNLYPASILRLHKSCTIYLDTDAARNLK